jgi:lipopolysaccharide/colanic/teichoic acid biosynthesis glycosyltransferase
VASAAREESRAYAEGRRRRAELTKRAVDVAVACVLLLLLAPVLAACALAIKLETPGPVFYRARRVGRNGRQLRMLKFRKMHRDAAGPALTAPDDERFTRVGRILVAWKLDELPQLFNVVKGDMSLVGPRPEDPLFVSLHRVEYDRILAVRPGMTGLSQLAFAKESRVLTTENRIDDYVARILPQKMGMDMLYAAHASVLMDIKILTWTAAAVCLQRDVAVNRKTGALTLRSRPLGGELARTAEPATLEPVPAEMAATT